MAQHLPRSFPWRASLSAMTATPLLRGALGAEDGAVIGIGTGSFLGRQTGGQIALMGGWGLALGDEASGAFLGRAALSATLRAREGWGAATEFTRALEQELGGEAGIIAFASTATPAQYAALAPRIAEAARGGDPVCGRILQQGADYISAGLAHLGWAPGERLCAMGGLAGVYDPYLPMTLSEPLGSALDGALTLARRIA